MPALSVWKRAIFASTLAFLSLLALPSLSARAQQVPNPQQDVIKTQQTIFATGAWSKVVDGLQARLIVMDTVTSYTTENRNNHQLGVRLEMQNVSGPEALVLFYEPQKSAQGKFDGPGMNDFLAEDGNGYFYHPSELTLLRSSIFNFPIHFGTQYLPFGKTIVEKWAQDPTDKRVFVLTVTFTAKATDAMRKRQAMVEEHRKDSKNWAKYFGDPQPTIWEGTLDLPPVRLAHSADPPPATP